MADDLEARLKSHAKAFDGLLSLIPAKLYYGEDNSDQWKKKKQTKEEARQAKRAKLDPHSSKSVKDVMDENELKRKRDDEGGSEKGENDKEQPKRPSSISKNRSKKQKLEQRSPEVPQELDEIEVNGTAQPEESQREVVEKRAKSDKNKEKKERKRAKVAKKQANQKAKAASKGDRAIGEVRDGEHDGEDTDRLGESVRGDRDLGPLDVAGIGEDNDSRSTVSPTPAPDSPIFDVSGIQSGASSSSSVGPPPRTDKAKKPNADPDILKARLQARIEALRAARKADGINGGPARNRQELMDARRKKEEQRRAHKKELRQMAKEEEQRQREAALVSRHSPASLSFDGSPRPHDPKPDNNFSFGKVAFSDGQQLDSGISTLLNVRKPKGPQDPLTAINAVENKRSRINGLDEAKRADIEEKDLWLNAQKRAHGEKVRDDTSLLKKTLKRKDKAKKRSESQWNERIEGVEKGRAMKQKRREGNLRKRKEEKGTKGKKKAGKPGKKVKNRPGFEGTFKGKVGGSKK
ncbi:MAG: hypothetical protein M1812_004728 [Candelaria pacifica]|nr:MAG: hypothetical protein M1812_004728 [Candelaria pacifica]